MTLDAAAAPEVQRDLAYGPDPRHRLDLYRPARPNGALLVDVHGGGWVQGDKSKEAALATRLSDAGYLVAAPNYRFADGQAGVALYPAQVDDLLAAVNWLKAADAVAFDRARIGAIGGSSGGNLAFELAISLGVPGASWSGLLDLAGFMARHGDAVPHRVVIDDSRPSAEIDQGGADPGYYKWLLFNLLGPGLDGIGVATPINRVTAATGPMLFANSMAELVPPEEMLIAASALAGAGVPVRTVLLEGSRHAGAYIDDIFVETLRFFDHYLSG
ncbi:MAG: alpha/beta hydrolase fold domain-containing protein [Bifidobacteriaceae bacterium]|jgi:acetyl esterase/lipase|nr:alpha/beta hydrolase fold domain-containing protein [Bifidobacteriaceae bacterium]